jgi:hypothetical protein
MTRAPYQPANCRRSTGPVQTAVKKNSWPVFLFLISLIVPWIITLGPLRLSLYRFLLLAMLLPCLVKWITGRAGRVRLADIVLILYSFWCALSLIVIHGLAIAAEPAGIGLIETLGAYFLARCYIRDADDLRNAVKLLFRTVLFLMPFAFFELVSGHNLLREAFGMILPTAVYPSEQRSGFTRVLSVFDHPIMTGLYAGSILGLVHLVLGNQKSLMWRSFRSFTIVATAFMSLSAGPIGAVAMQVFLLSWNGLLRRMRSRWKLLISLLLGLVVLLQIVAKRSALTIITSFFLFDSASYWYRRLIWFYGSATVMNHPLFGVGLNDWERPAWMPTASIDNFWLFQAIRSGLLAPTLLLLAFFLIVLAVGLKKDLDYKLVEYRTGFLITMTFFFLGGWTAHFWGNVYALFLFLMGSGVWILDAQATERDGHGRKIHGVSCLERPGFNDRSRSSANLAPIEWSVPVGSSRRNAADEIEEPLSDWRS